MVYLDYAATCPTDPRVVAKMSEYLSFEGHFGNAGSHHAFGQTAKLAIEKARFQVASLINTLPENIIWTSGATEANNLAIKGALSFYQRRGKHIITSQTEHRAVLETCQASVRQGFSVTYLKPQSNGLIDLESLKEALQEDTILVSIMHVNNETGVIQDIEAMGKMLRERNILFHVDAAQSVGKLPIDLKKTSVDLMSFSAHKIYGPKGIGALFINDEPKVRLIPQQNGGGQERGLRSGTLPTHQCVGMGEAFEIAKNEMMLEQEKIKKLRHIFLQGIENLPGVMINGHATLCSPYIVNICFANNERDTLVSSLNDLAFSLSSACIGTHIDTSHVLRAMGLRNELAHRSLRFSFGRYLSEQDIHHAVKLIQDGVVKCQS